MNIVKNIKNFFTSKKPKTNRQWVAATNTKAYLLKDPILDWLKYHNTKLTSYTTEVNNALQLEKNNLEFTPFIMNKGVQFENKIVDILKEKFGEDFVHAGGDYKNVYSDELFEKTKSLIKSGIPIIYSGVLHNDNDYTLGIPDLIVRDDYVAKIFNEAPIIPIRRTRYYLIIDIKFKTLNLRADGIHLLNDGMVPAYKSQLLIYNRALARVQNFDPKISFILGRRWQYNSKNTTYSGLGSFDKAGVINFGNVDSSFLKLTDEAIKWVRDVKENGSSWNPLDRTNPNLFPNMSNKYDFPWTEIKKKISNELHEITELWMCSVKHRQNAHKRNILSWADPRCNLNALGIKGPVISKILKPLLLVNQRKNIKILPNRIETNILDWKTKNKVEFFIDFETVNDAIMTNFENLPISEKMQMIFQIGVGHVVNEVWTYRSFMVNDFTEKEEVNIILEFSKYVTGIAKKSRCRYPSFFHWHNTEYNLLSSVIEKYDLDVPIFSNAKWIDMLVVFKTEPIVLKGCMDFSLKSIANVMHQLGMIQTIWNTNDISNGANVMVAAYKAQEKVKSSGGNLKDTEYMRDIEKYNEIDCKTICEIVKYLRNNHI